MVNTSSISNTSWLEDDLLGEKWKDPFLSWTKLFSKNEIKRVLGYTESIPKVNTNKILLISYFFSEVEKFLFKPIYDNPYEQVNEISWLKEVFTFCYEKYKGKYRKNWEESIIHLIKTALYIIEQFPNPSIEKIKVALLHDVIEDWYSSFEEIREKFWDSIAISILALSKNDISFYFNNNNTYLDKQGKETIINSWICDDKWKLKKWIKEKWEKWKLDNNQNNAYKLYKKIDKTRSEEYFSRFESLESMTKYIKKLAIEKWIILTESDLEKIIQNVFDSKFGDRCHNLCTQWDPYWIRKIKRKIKETEKCLLPIASKLNIIAWLIMSSYIKELNDLEISVEWEVIWTLWWLDWKKMDIVEIDMWERNLHWKNLFSIWEK